MYDNFTPSFAKQYVNVGEIMDETFRRYRQEVIDGDFPGKEHSCGMSDAVMEEIEKEFGAA